MIRMQFVLHAGFGVADPNGAVNHAHDTQGLLFSAGGGSEEPGTAVAPSTPLAGETASTREQQLKAAYLVNFLNFIEWPSASNGPIVVCFAGADGVRAALEKGIESRRVGARALAVQRVTGADEVNGCGLLYLEAQQVTGSNGLLLRAVPAGVLTVSDSEAFVRDGGMIELFTESNRLRFKVNLANAQRAGLRISSSLLQLAASVMREVSMPAQEKISE